MNGPTQYSKIARRRIRSALLAIASLVCAFAPARAGAVTTLTVDLSKPIGAATHAANGSLYGVLETQPADVQGLIAPLHPNMFNNPAADVQQPVGDAIIVAGRVAPVGATVTIRFADWFTGWYAFTNMTDWFSKIDQTIGRKKSANLTNIYAYELWNEPNGTWNSSSPNTTSSNGSNLSFNAFWAQTYAHVRQQDPGVRITGPSVAGYDESYLSAFLSYCKANGCLPDIVGWHDGSNVQNNVNAYRALEKQLGIGPLPITINEYSLTADVTHEGEPGASATLIAAMERTRVDSACITFWDTAHPGRLGSFLATNTQTNGGWFFYKWYGEMTGNMLATASSLSSGNGNFDGFASLDPAMGVASVLAGGTNDGTIQIVVSGFQAAGAGSTVHAVVEYTPWGNRTTVVTATNTISTADLTVSDGQITVMIPNANATNGYHLALTWPGGGWVDASAPETGTMDAGTVDATTDASSGEEEEQDASSGEMDAGATDGATDSSGSGGTLVDAGAAPAPAKERGCSCSFPGEYDESAFLWLGAAAPGLLALGRRRYRTARGPKR